MKIPDLNKKQIAGRARKILASEKLSPKQAASLLKIRELALQQFLQGKKLSAKTVFKFIHHFKVNPEYLLFGFGKMHSFQPGKFGPTARWFSKYFTIIKFVNENKRMPICSRKRTPEKGLYEWLYHNKISWNSGILHRDKRALLSILPFEWNYKDREFIWEAMYKKVATIQKKYNSPEPIIERYTRLINWVNVQRANYGAGTLRPDRFKKLRAINFSFSKNEDNWRKWYQKYLAFYASEGKNPSCVASRGSLEYSLFIWEGKQRGRIRNKTIKPDRLNLLKKSPASKRFFLQ